MGIGATDILRRVTGSPELIVPADARHFDSNTRPEDKVPSRAVSNDKSKDL